jgi:hypothetical protein
MMPIVKLPEGENKKCNWETVAPDTVCNKPALWKGVVGDRFYCKEHGEYILRRYTKGNYTL